MACVHDKESIIISRELISIYAPLLTTGCHDSPHNASRDDFPHYVRKETSNGDQKGQQEVRDS